MQSKRKSRSEEAAIEMDPTFARNVGLTDGSKVCPLETFWVLSMVVI